MKTRIFTFLVAFLATVGNAVWGQTTITIDLSNPKAATGVTVTESPDKVITITAGGNYSVTGTTSEYCLGVAANSATTITFTNVTIDVAANNLSRSPFKIAENNQGNVTLIINGNNVLRDENRKCTALTVFSGQNLNIKGSGILRAEGFTGIGNSIGVCGNITVESGTVVARGSAYSIGGNSSNPSNPPKFTIGNGAFVVAYDPNQNNQSFANIEFDEENVENGIYCNYRNDGSKATVYGDNVTLNSPFPNENFTIDLAGKTLTLGEGSYAREDQININGGTLNAYHVKYSKPTITNTNVSDAPADMYCGPNTALSTDEMKVTASGATYTYLGWTKTAEGADKGTFTTLSDDDEVNGIKDIPVEATFLLTQYSLDIVTGTKLAEGFGLVYPTTANVTVTDAESDPKLAAIGAKLSDDTKSVVQGDDVATIGKDYQTKKVTLKATYTDANNTSQTKDVVLNLNVVDNRIDITNGTLSFNEGSGTKVYDAQAVDPTSLSWSITVTGQQSPIEPGGGLTLKFKENESDANYMTSNPVNVGTYYAYVVAGNEPDATYTGTTAAATYTITAKGITTVSIEPETIEWTIGSQSNPEIKSVTFSSTDILDADKKTVTIKTTNTNFMETMPTTPGEYTITYALQLDGNTNNNYSLTNTSATGTLKATKEGSTDDPIQPGDPKDDETEIKIEGDDWKWDATLNEGKGGYKKVYDGETYTLKKANLVYVRQKNAENPDNPWIAVPADAITISSVTPNENLKNADTYTVKLSITKSDELLYSGVVGDITLVITPRPMDVTIKPLNATDLDKTSVNTDMVTFEKEEKDRGLVTDEPAGVSGTIKIEENSGAAEDGMKHYTVTFSNLQLENSGDNASFLAANYKPTFKYGDNEITEAGIDVPIGDIEPGKDTDIDDGNGDDKNNWSLSADNYYEVVYDGEQHGISTVTITTGEGEAEGTVTKAAYTALDGTPISGDKPIDAGYYIANVVISFGDESKTGSFPLHIKPRPLGVNFNLSGLTEEYAGKTLKAIDYADYINVTGETVSGPLDNEEPAIDENGELIIADAPSANGKYGVTLNGILFIENDNFKPSNYRLEPYINGIKVTDYDKDTGDGSFGGDGNDEGGISFDTDDDNQGGNWNDYPDYYNIYVDTCQGVWLERSTKVVREGNSVRIKVEIEEGTDTTNLELKFKRSLFGNWEDLTQFKTETPDEYLIKNIYTDIYVMAKGAVPTGIEDIDEVQAKVYSKDGSIYVQTPKQEQVLIISISGAIVKNKKQIGLQRYDGLQRGVYVVKVGKQVFKIRN